MAKIFKSNEVFNGSFGKLWIDGEILANIKANTTTVTLTWEAVDVAGELGQHQKLLGYEIAGTFTLHKVDSFVAKKYKDLQKGIIPELSIISAIDDPAAKGAERIKLEEVTLDSFDIASFEMKSKMEEAIPYKAAYYKMLDVV